MSLSAINYEQLEKLESLTQNHLQAKLLDRFLYWWQFSRYTLNDKQKWFTRSVKDMAEQTGISVRSIARYMNLFEKAGLIERRCVLFKKKNLYIRITEKLLRLLGKEPQKTSLDTAKPEQNLNNLPTEGSNENAPVAVSYIRSKKQIIKTNSTVSQNGSVNNSDELTKNPNIQAKTESTENSEYKIEKDIGERLTSRFKNYIKGVLNNLQSQHNVIFSNPDKVFAEVVFAVTHEDNQLKGISNPHHRMNIIAKLMREQRWRTPKGFYNHWDIGKLFRERDEVKQRRYEAQKQEEGVDNTCIAQEKRFDRKPHTAKQQYQAKLDNKRKLADIRELETEINSQQRYLSQLEQWLTEGRVGISQETVDSCAMSVAKLYEQLTELKTNSEH